VKRFVAVLGGGVALSFAGGALAQDGGAQDEAIDDGLYVRIAAGASFVSDWEQDFTFNPSLVFAGGPPNGQNLSLDEGVTFGGALGFDYADGIRTELEYRYASTDIESVTTLGGPAPGAAVPSDEDISAHLLMANFYFDFTNDSPLTPFIGGGVGGAFVTNENGGRDAALAYQGRAGVSLAMGGGFSADMEYIYLRTNKLVYGPADEGFTSAGPPVRIDGDRYQSSSVMLSLRKQF